MVQLKNISALILVGIRLENSGSNSGNLSRIGNGKSYKPVLFRKICDFVFIGIDKISVIMIDDFSKES